DDQVEVSSLEVGVGVGVGVQPAVVAGGATVRPGGGDEASLSRPRSTVNPTIASTTRVTGTTTSRVVPTGPGPRRRGGGGRDPGDGGGPGGGGPGGAPNGPSAGDRPGGAVGPVPQPPGCCHGLFGPAPG